jgi:hypothetical protein
MFSCDEHTPEWGADRVAADGITESDSLCGQGINVGRDGRILLVNRQGMVTHLVSKYKYDIGLILPNTGKGTINQSNDNGMQNIPGS